MTQTQLRVAELPKNRPVAFSLRPDAVENSAIATQLGLLGLRKLSFKGTLHPAGKSDWRLEAQLGATVVQACVVTLDPVTTRLNEPVVRQFLAKMPETPDGEEIELEDDTIEALPAVIDLVEVMIESLALALPLYPRQDGAGIGQLSTTEPGATPLSDDDVKPFAALAALKDKLEKGQ